MWHTLSFYRPFSMSAILANNDSLRWKVRRLVIMTVNTQWYREPPAAAPQSPKPHTLSTDETRPRPCLWGSPATHPSHPDKCHSHHVSVVVHRTLTTHGATIRWKLLETVLQLWLTCSYLLNVWVTLMQPTIIVGPPCILRTNWTISK